MQPELELTIKSEADRAVPQHSGLGTAGLQARPWRLLLGCAGLVVVAVLYWFDPAVHGFYPRCAFHTFTGLLCPGCGGLRAGHQLLHGHWGAALRLNPLLPLLVPLLALLFTPRTAATWFKPGRFAQLRRVAIVLLLAAMGVLAVWRNFPGSPFAR